MRSPADYLINLWLDQMILAGFTAARWWAQVAMGAQAPLETEHGNRHPVPALLGRRIFGGAIGAGNRQSVLQGRLRCNF